MKVLMVCLGNICRSPLAQGILQDKIDRLGLPWQVDSAGTSGYHNGNPPDPRSISEALKHSIDISYQKSRVITISDLEDFDLVLVMDTSNYQNVMKLAENKFQRDKIKLILNYVFPAQNKPVPDPYYDGGFHVVYDLLDRATDQVIKNHTAENL